MITEEIAKTKLCPFIRYCVNELAVVQDKDAPLYAQSNCAGSDCMAWRTVEDEYEVVRTSLGQIPKGEGWRQIMARAAMSIETGGPKGQRHAALPAKRGGDEIRLAEAGNAELPIRIHRRIAGQAVGRQQNIQYMQPNWPQPGNQTTPRHGKRRTA